MSGFVQPQWSGFSLPDPGASEEARPVRHEPDHELDRATVTPAPPPADRPPQATEQPKPVTPASPRPDKALSP